MAVVRELPSRPSVGTALRRALALRCPRCGQGRVFDGWFAMRATCEACGLKYEREDWGRGFKPTDSAEFRKINPIGVVPVIDDDGFRLRESNTIVRYLAEKHGRADLYPKDLQQLVDGVSLQNDATGKKLRFLRRIPIDPMTNRAEWKLRGSQDDPKSTVWNGINVWDVASKSEGKALDGTFYKDWD